MRTFLRDNGLSLAFWLLFAATMAGDVGCVVALQREEPVTHADRGLAAALGSPEFLKGVFGNWQAALLQLLTLIVLARYLRQRGASHSREPADEAAREALTAPKRPDHPDESAFGRRFPFLHQHSLSIAFVLLWLPTLGAFFAVDRAAANEERLRAGERALTALGFLGSARFWFDVFQTWQAEFFAMAVFLPLTIVLREKDSPESKAVGAGNRETGDVNE